MNTLDVQRRLRALGYDPGPVDGAWGPLTRAAVKAFQADHDLVVDGIVGPATIGELMPSRRDPMAPAILPPWYETAKRELGTQERKDKIEIAEWASILGLRGFDATTVPWCGLFVAHCIGSTLPDEPMPSNVLGARNWAKFGVECEPQVGAVMVFWRGSRTGWQGHVAFYAGEDADAYSVLGGNQSDAVTITRISKSRLLASRWPSTAPFFLTGKGSAVGGSLSENEQ